MLGMLIAALLSAAAPRASAADNVGVNLSLTINSATTLTTSLCTTGQIDRTAFGTVLPGNSYVTGADCQVDFGAAGDHAMLRLFQDDGGGSAMHQMTTGGLDTAFDGDSGNGNGWVTTDFGGTDYATAIDQAPSACGDKFVVAGRKDTDVAVARYNANGTLDTSFNTTGKVTADGGATENVGSVHVLSDCSVLVTGRSTVVSATDRFMFMKFTSAGALDTSFDGDSANYGYPGNGIVIIDIGVSTDAAYESRVQPDNRTVAVGSCGAINSENVCLVRINNSDGTLDTNFSFDGKVNTDFGGSELGRGIDLYPDGRIVAVGNSDMGPDPTYRDTLVARLLADGTYDTSWDTDGMRFYDLPQDDIGTAYSDDRAVTVAIRSDGSLIVGASFTGFALSVYEIVAVLLPNGNYDTRFSTTGIHYWFNGYNRSVRRVGLEGDGKFLLLNYADADDTGKWNGYVARFDPTLTSAFDTSFDGDGKAVYDTTGADYTYDMERVRDGSWVMVGSLGTDFQLTKIGTTALSNYVNTTTDWDTASTSLFGACLRSVANNATAVWTANATCPKTDGAYWNKIPDSTGDSAAKVANSLTVGTTNARVNLRWGMRTPAGQTPGRYIAPMVFEVLAPNV